MKKYFSLSLILFATLISNNIFAQEKGKVGVSNVFKANFFLPGISYEQKIVNFTTVNFIAYMNILTAITSSQSSYYGTVSKYYFCPAFNIEIRNYYNYKRRERKGARTEMNSLNYFGPLFNGNYLKATSNSDGNLVSVIGAIWGMQRNYPKRFSLDFNLGLGYLFNAPVFKNNNSLYPIAQVTLGFWLNKKPS